MHILYSCERDIYFLRIYDHVLYNISAEKDEIENGVLVTFENLHQKKVSKKF